MYPVLHRRGSKKKKKKKMENSRFAISRIIQFAVVSLNRAKPLPTNFLRARNTRKNSFDAVWVPPPRRKWRRILIAISFLYLCFGKSFSFGVHVEGWTYAQVFFSREDELKYLSSLNMILGVYGRKMNRIEMRAVLADVGFTKEEFVRHFGREKRGLFRHESK